MWLDLGKTGASQDIAPEDVDHSALHEEVFDALIIRVVENASRFMGEATLSLPICGPNPPPVKQPCKKLDLERSSGFPYCLGSLAISVGGELSCVNGFCSIHAAGIPSANPNVLGTGV